MKPSDCANPEYPSFLAMFSSGSLRWRFGILACAMFAVAGTVSAQASDSTPSPPKVQWPIRLWVSGGLGGASLYRGAGLAVRSSATLSFRRGVLLVRRTKASGAADSYVDITEGSILGGMRLGWKHLYLTPAIGIGDAKWTYDVCDAGISCTQDALAQNQDKGRGMAYDIGLNASWRIVGVGFNIGGLRGAEKRTMTANVISVQLGWFGR